MKYDYTIGIAPQNFKRFDFVIIPTTHLHFTGYTISKEQSETVQGRVDTWINKLEALLSMDLPFHKIGIAHLASTLIGKNKEESY